jgi:ribosomal protein S3
MRSPSINNMIVYNEAHQTTKYGTFGIKIWVAHKLVYNKKHE